MQIIKLILYFHINFNNISLKALTEGSALDSLRPDTGSSLKRGLVS